MTTNPTRSLRLQVRLLWGALLLTFFTAAAGHVHLLWLADADGRPDSSVNLSGPTWTGTLDPARLPANAPLLSAVDQSLTLPANEAVGGTVRAVGGFYAGGNQIADASGSVFATGGIYLGGNTVVDSGRNLYGSALYVNGAQMGEATVIGSLTANDVQAGAGVYVNGNLVIDSEDNLYPLRVYLTESLTGPDGNLVIDADGNLLRTSPDGTQWLISVDNTGVLHADKY